MTRWVRSGSTQKHKKVPGEATKWGEFDHQKKKKLSNIQKEVKTEPNAEKSKKSQCSSNFLGSGNFDLVENHEGFQHSDKVSYSDSSPNKASEKQILVSHKKNKKNKMRGVTNEEPFKSSWLQEEVKQELNSKRSKKSQGSTSTFLKSGNFDSFEDREGFHSDKAASPPDSLVQKISGEQTPVSHKKKFKNEKNKIKDESKNQLSNDKPFKSSGKAFERNKNMYMKKLLDKRTQNGILLLPSKVERKLYIIKKKLRGKNVPPDVLKEIIRKERRKEELKFRKTFNPSKLCFNCRQPGHILADCPKEVGPSSQGTGMCFKCGSIEHTSSRCTKLVQGFPFATCFICKEQGHISKDCPKNKRGIYPKGGRCNLCGNVNHLKKDCPSLKKKEPDEPDITLHTINETTSIDDEVFEKKIKRELVKKPKIVKF